MSCSELNTEAIERRRRWLSLLAKAPAARLDSLWQALEPAPSYTILRQPEIGLIMLQGRISGTGAPFCAGEMTVTRAAVRLASGEVGFGYVGGVETGGVGFGGQRDDWRERLEAEIVAPLAREAEARHRLIAARAAATKVEFFTVAREAGT